MPNVFIFAQAKIICTDVFDSMSHRSYLWIQEAEIIHTLYDYLGSLDSEALYSEEETLEYFRRTIEHLKQSIKEASHCD